MHSLTQNLIIFNEKTMSGESRETLANSNNQTIDRNPYEIPNDNQQNQVTFGNIPAEPPPSYNDSIQSSSSPKVQPTNPPQSKTIFFHQKIIVIFLTGDSPNNPPTPTIVYRLGRHSTEVVCPNCHTTVRTRAETSSTFITIAIAIFIALFCLCLAIIPLCMSSCKKTVHYCPNCNYIIAKLDEFE